MHHVFYFKFILANLALAINLLLIFVRWPILERRPHLAIIGYYALRLAALAFILLKLKFGYPSENMSMYYYYAGLILHGAVPDRDFDMVYGILFPYLLAGAVYLWDNRFAIIILFQLAEFVGVFVIFTQKNVALTLRDFLLYALNPITLLWIWLGLANQVTCLIPAAAAIALRNETSRSALFAFGFAISKMFALWTIIPALLCQRIRSIIVFGVVLLVIYLPFLLMGSKGFSTSATEASGSVTNAAARPGVESLANIAALYVSDSTLASLVHGILLFTAGLLCLAILSACWLRLRLKLDWHDTSGPLRDKIVFTTIFATLLTLIYQAFATYTIPDYLLVVIVYLPFLVRFKFWTIWDQILVVVACYFQAIIFQIWFHFAEFGNARPLSNPLFLALELVGNACTIALCLRCAYRTYQFYAAEIPKSAIVK